METMTNYKNCQTEVKVDLTTNIKIERTEKTENYGTLFILFHL